jgi:hypothetical protein
MLPPLWHQTRKSGVRVAEDSGNLSLASKKVKYDTTAQVEAELLS